MSANPIARLLESLPERHRRALKWFEDQAGEIVPWPSPLSDGTLLATKPKGIYKPEWTKYALSVRRSLEGPYLDKPIQQNPDGSWTFLYFQEDLDPARRDQLYTNRDRKSTRLNSSHLKLSRMPSSA